MKDCICSMKCRIDVCGKKHHTLLDVKILHKATVKSTNKQDFKKPYEFLTFSKNNTCYSDIWCKHESSKCSAKLWFRHNFNNIKISENSKTKRKLNIATAISTSVSETSKLQFSICSTYHSNQIEVKTA